jgi:acyl-CoA synthetase (AMP-forming)/AMP-acid ligase II
VIGNRATLIDLLRLRARCDPSRTAYTFLRDGENDEVDLTYGELDRRATRTATLLAGMLAPGGRVLLIYPPGLEFLAAFFGCLYAGMVAVPACPPRPNQSLRALESIARDCGARAALTSPRLLDGMRPRWSDGASLARLRWCHLDDPAADRPGWVPAAVGADTVAYLQYTSGSTGLPKGVVVTHGNLIHNLRMIEEAFGHSEATVYVGWLPLFHDMGLVSMALQAAHLGVHCVLLPPLHFLQKPVRWLQAITRYRATSSGAPDFAYDLCVRTIRPEQRDALDLRSWAVAYNAAEPVRSETLGRFAEVFAPCGFRREAFYPCYGLAEATVFVTGGDHAAPPIVRRFGAAALEDGRVVAPPRADSRGRELVGCGRPWLGQRVLIVDPQTRRRCPADRVGEIWVGGPSVARGYWGRPRETRETFAASTADGDDGPFLRTGDLGFVHEGELFITGRLKDVIVIRGGNFYPQDIEATVQRSHPALPPGRGAAFSVELDGEERLVVLQEVRRHGRTALDVPSILEDVREAVAAEHGLRVHALVLIRTGRLPRTTSGKVRRRACRERLHDGTLDVRAADYGDPDCRWG